MNIIGKIRAGLYAILMSVNKWTGWNRRISAGTKPPLISFYGLRAINNSGDQFDFSACRGKKVLIVNSASGCGYTPQLNTLQSLLERKAADMMLIAFPSPDFRDQEKRTDEEIHAFCAMQGVKFPVMKKCRVKKGEGQEPVFYWLTHAAANGWNDRDPEWNFCKYLINEDGRLIHVFGPGVDPREIESYL